MTELSPDEVRILRRSGKVTLLDMPPEPIKPTRPEPLAPAAPEHKPDDSPGGRAAAQMQYELLLAEYRPLIDKYDREYEEYFRLRQEYEAYKGQPKQTLVDAAIARQNIERDIAAVRAGRQSGRRYFVRDR